MVLELGLEDDEELVCVDELIGVFDWSLFPLQIVGLLLPFFPVYFEKTDELIFLIADFSFLLNEVSVPTSCCKNIVTFFCALVIAVYRSSIDRR